MITSSIYKKMLGNIETEGKARKYYTDMIMEYTMMRDPESQIGYFYDAYHNNGEEKFKLNDLHPYDDESKVPIKLKMAMVTSQTYDKDDVTYHIMFAPSQECCVDYYKEVFEDRYNAMWPIGMYVDLLDSHNRYNRWLVVGCADVNRFNNNTFNVLRCDKVFQWIHDRKRYQCVGVQRSQNSYNSGIWTDYKTTGVEDVHKFCVPLNRDTETLYYNKRLIVDAKVLTEPRAWQISKVERNVSNGIVIITIAQDLFNAHTDYIEKDIKGNIIGMWANYYEKQVLPPKEEDDRDSSQQGYTAIISIDGISSTLKVGGSFKTFTMTYYDMDGKQFYPKEYVWKFELDGKECPSDLIDVKYPVDSPTLEDNEIRVKFIGDEDYYGSILRIYNDDCSISVDIIGL